MTFILPRCASTGRTAFRATRWRCDPDVRYSSTSTGKDSLQGSVSPHTRHLMLFTGRKFDTIPSHIDTVSPLYREIIERAKTEKAYEGYLLGVTDATHSLTAPSKIAWQAEVNRFDAPSEQNQQEAYGAVVYPDRIAVPFALSLENLKSGRLEEWCTTLSERRIDDSSASGRLDTSKPEAIDVFVCTHGARDCRCGDLGGAFYDALVSEARRRRIGGAADAFDAGKGRIKIHRTTHIGGHRFAATCITSHGDWYGLLSASDAPKFLDYLLVSPSPTSTWWEKWRGRAGLSQEAQLKLAQQGVERKGSGGALELASSLKEKGKKSRTKALGDAQDIPFRTHEGEDFTLRGFGGETLMDVAKRHDLVEATCGGACECATCHIYLRMPESGEVAPVTGVSEEEADQLEYAIFSDDDSRLACQLEITDELVEWFKAGGKIQLPRY